MFHIPELKKKKILPGCISLVFICVLPNTASPINVLLFLLKKPQAKFNWNNMSLIIIGHLNIRSQPEFNQKYSILGQADSMSSWVFFHFLWPGYLWKSSKRDSPGAIWWLLEE